MKKFLHIFFLVFVFLCFTNISAHSKDMVSSKIFAVVPIPFSAEDVNNNKEVDLASFSDYELNNISIKKNDKLTIVLDEYVEAKRGKRNAYFKIRLKSVNDVPLEDNFTGIMKISEPKDIQGIAEKTGAAVTGAVLKIPGFSQGLAVIKGIVSPNENETRIKSAGTNLYQSTPFSYMGKGHDFLIEENGIVILKLKERD